MAAAVIAVIQSQPRTCAEPSWPRPMMAFHVKDNRNEASKTMQARVMRRRHRLVGSASAALLPQLFAHAEPSPTSHHISQSFLACQIQMFVLISPAGALGLRQQGGRDGLSRPFVFSST